MSAKTSVWEETEYFDMDLMSQVRRIMTEGKTGQLVLHLSQGRVCRVTLKEKVFLDRESTKSAECSSIAVAQTQS
jgi:hypothetical protein